MRRPCSRLSVASAAPMRVPPDQSVVAAVDLRELLDAALEAPPRAGAEHERADPHAMPSSMSSASSSSERSELPGSSRSTCGSAARMPRVSGS